MEYTVLLLLLLGLTILLRAIGGARRRRQRPRREGSNRRGVVRSIRSAKDWLKSSRANSEGSQPFDHKTGHAPPSRTVIQGRAQVVDGDTIIIGKTQIRLFGIDAPEINHPHGRNAKWALISLCKGQTVSAEVIETDAYGRAVARCHLPDGRDLSAEMVKLGLAIDWPKFSGGIYRFLEAHDARKRLWLADARQKGRMHVWEQFEAKNLTRDFGK